MNDRRMRAELQEALNAEGAEDAEETRKQSAIHRWFEQSFVEFAFLRVLRVPRVERFSFDVDHSSEYVFR